MDIYKEATELFPYIEGDFLVGKNVTLTIKNVKSEMLPDHRGKDVKKYVVYFKETAKGLVLNKTNCRAIIILHGKETNDWKGKRVTLFSQEVQAFGEWHNAVRVAPTNPDSNTSDEPMSQPEAIAAMNEPDPLFEMEPEAPIHYGHDAE